MSAQIIDSRSLFPPPSSIVAERIAPDQLTDRFQELWSRITMRFFKCERLQAYEEPGDPSYEAFLRGDAVTAERCLEERIAGETPLFLDLARKAAAYIRVRIVEPPLSAYLRYEFASYRIGSRYGQRVLVLDLSTVQHATAFAQAWDFMLFDDHAAMVQEYTPEGQLQAVHVVEGREHVVGYSRLAQAMMVSSVPLGVYERTVSGR